MGGVDWEYLTRGFSNGFNMGMQIAERKRQAARDAEADRRYAEQQQRQAVMDSRSAEQFEWQRAEQQRTNQIRQGAIDIEDQRAAGAYTTPERAISTDVQVKSDATFAPSDMGGAAAVAAPGQQLPNVSPQAGTQPKRKTVSAKAGGEFDGAKYYGDLAAFYRRYGDAKTGMEYDNLAKQEPHRVFMEQVQKFDQAVKMGDTAGAAKALQDTFNKGFPDGRIATVNFENGVFRARFFNSEDGGPMGEQVLSVDQAQKLTMSVMDPKAFYEGLAEAQKRKHDFDLKAFELFAKVASENDEWHEMEIRTGEHTTGIVGYINRKTGQVKWNGAFTGGGGVGEGKYKDYIKEIHLHLEKSGDEGFGDRITEGVSLTNHIMNFNKNMDTASGIAVAKAAMQGGDKGVHVVTGKRYVPYNGRLYAIDPATPAEIKAAEGVINEALKPAPAKKDEKPAAEKKPAASFSGAPAKPTATRGRGAPATAPAPNRSRPSGVQFEEPEVKAARKKVEEMQGNDGIVGVPVGTASRPKQSYKDGGKVSDAGEWKRSESLTAYQRALTSQGFSFNEWEKFSPAQRKAIQKTVIETPPPKRMADGGQISSVRDQAYRDVEMLMGTTGGVEY